VSRERRRWRAPWRAVAEMQMGHGPSRTRTDAASAAALLGPQATAGFGGRTRKVEKFHTVQK